MNPRRDLAPVLSGDARYAWQAYAFVLEVLEHHRLQKQRLRSRSRDRRKPETPESHHMTGQELCEAARDLALHQYGMLARLVLGQWGVNTTSDLGEIVYNMIAAGHLEKTPTDRRSDFNDVFDFESAFGRRDVLILDNEA